VDTTPPFALQGVTPPEGELSDKQTRILDFIQHFYAENQRPPTNREIGRGVGIRSTSHVNYHLRILEEKGRIERIRNTSRGLRLKTTATHDGDTLAVRLMGRIAAGQPIETATTHDEVVMIPAEYAGADEAYALRVSGDSMVDELIGDGDLIVVRPYPSPQDGDVVVATISDGHGGTSATLKRFYREKERIRLQPANSAMQPIYVDPDKVTIQGRVMAVLRKL
jgi:repressor LexA